MKIKFITQKFYCKDNIAVGRSRKISALLNIKTQIGAAGSFIKQDVQKIYYDAEHFPIVGNDCRQFRAGIHGICSGRENFFFSDKPRRFVAIGNQSYTVCRFKAQIMNDAKIEQSRGEGLFALERLEAQPSPTNIEKLKEFVSDKYGVLDLLDVFLEADNLADFTNYFRHSGTKQVRSQEQLRPLILLDLFAEGTNTGIKRIARATHFYKYDELLYVRKHYFSPEALRAANVAVVNKILELRNPHL